MKLVVERDVVNVMDLSSSEILNSAPCDVQLAKLIQTASDPSCVMWIRAAMNLVEEQSHRALTRGTAPRARCRDLLIPLCGLHGSVRKASRITGRTADIFKIVEDTGTSGEKG